MCTPLRDSSGKVVGFVCGERHARAKPCAYCGRPAAVLCDGLHQTNAAKTTCDTPLCRRCAHHVAPDHDYCREHRPTPDLVDRLSDEEVEARALALVDECFPGLLV